MRPLLPLLLAGGITVFAAGNLLPGDSFELPAVKGRTPKEQGGDPANNGRGPEWIAFKFRNDGRHGKVTGGLTDEVARTGKQSLFVRFDHVDGAYQSATLISNFIPVVSGTDYEVGIWGRTDAADLVDSKGRSAYLKLEVDYFAKDANESVPETFYAVQPLPGSKDHEPYFKPDGWNRFSVRLTTPPGAVFAQITWRWETGSDPGEINGIMYFDDVTMTGPPAANPNLKPSPVQEEETPAPGGAGSPAAQ
jgi:hypothetical protein